MQDFSDINREYGPEYRYMSPPNMPGVRQLYGVQEPNYHVSGMNCGGYLGPNWIPPNNLPMIRKMHLRNQLEGFGSGCAGSFGNLLITIIVLCIIITLAMYFLSEKKKTIY
ncbi:MAG: hypothetical protein Homavirus10_3 [Homavirus sp.]|uniref:Uncharacterized protein n=1 Tax=Homavirus sp. TaxID=2487769 RepID=A0A3G5A6M7_9VIRU|nr:MAG: hypothetical protein Homavirus10_3 [Homavirus sp.]